MDQQQHMRNTQSGFPRLLEGEDRNKFIAAVRSPIARDLLNYDVSLTLQVILELG